MSTPEPTLDCEVIGFRQWKVNDDMRLTGAHVATHEWKPGENHAECILTNTAYIRYQLFGDQRQLDHHPAPGADCECGFYALHAPDFWYGLESNRGLTHMAYGMGEAFYVAGLVAGWGRMEVHRTGFRAEFARIVAIAIPPRRRDATLARAVAAEYGVPTVPQKELEAVATEFGQRMPEHLVPEKPRRVSATDIAALYGIPASYLYPSPAPKEKASRGELHEMGRLLQRAMKTQALAIPKASPVEQVRAKRPRYDPRQFMPKRNGGNR